MEFFLGCLGIGFIFFLSFAGAGVYEYLSGKGDNEIYKD